MSLLQKETKFEQHRPVEAKALEATSLVLTTKSSVAGKLVLIGVPGTPPGAIIPRFDCTLRGVSFPTGQAGNDYLSTTDSTGRSVVRCNVRIELLPDTSLLLQGLKPCLDRLRLVANLLVNLMSRQVRIDVSGGTIQGFEGEGSSRVLVINCVGNRLVEIEGDRVCTLVLAWAPKGKGANPSSTANAATWLESPSPPPAYSPTGGLLASATAPNLAQTPTSRGMPTPSEPLRRVNSNASSTDNRLPLSAHLPNISSIPTGARQAVDGRSKRRMSDMTQDGPDEPAKRPRMGEEFGASGGSGMSGNGSTSSAEGVTRGAQSMVNNNPPPLNHHHDYQRQFAPPPSLPSQPDPQRQSQSASNGNQSLPLNPTQSVSAAPQRVNLTSGQPAKPLRRISDMRGVLQDALQRRIPGDPEVNVVGIIIKSSGLKQIRGQDWMITVIITDETVVGAASTSDDYQVGFFCKEQGQLPQLPIGTPIFFRDLHLQTNNGKPRGQGRARKATWASLQGDNVKYMDPSDPKLTSDELARLKWIRDWRNPPTGGRQAVQLSGGGSGRPVWQLKDVRVGHNCFFDFTAKVVEVFDHQNTGSTYGGVALEVYLADGTTYDGLLQNFHGAGSEYPSGSVVRLSIYTPQDEEIMRNCFQIGKVIKIPNIRPKLYNSALELAWNEKLTGDQTAMGWKVKKIGCLDENDQDAVNVERQICTLLGRPFHPVTKQLTHPVDNNPSQRYDRPAAPNNLNPPPICYNTPASAFHDRAPAAATNPAPNQSHAPRAGSSVTTHSKPRTSYEGLDRYGYTPLAEISTNMTVPNKYKTRARVLRVESANKKGGGYTTKFCKKCNQSFDKPYCGSCNDAKLSNAELRYRLTLFLTTADDIDTSTSCDSSDTLAVLLSDTAAAKILPPLPPLDSSVNADKKKVQALKKRLAAGKEDIDSLLMGDSVNGGSRERPAADWELESYTAKSKAHGGGRGKESVIIYTVSGRKAI